MIKIIAGTLTQFFEKIELETLILLGFFCGFNMPKRNLNILTCNDYILFIFVLICQRGI